MTTGARMLGVGVAVAACATAFTLLQPAPSFAGVKCVDRDDLSGECNVWEGKDDGRNKIPEPKEGQKWTEENFSTNCSGSPVDDFDACSQLDPCPEGDDYTHYAVQERDWKFTDGEWVRQNDWRDAHPFVQCRKPPPDEITNQDVRRAAEEFGMKSGTVHTAPPGGKTLLDFDTIVWADQGPYEFELDLDGIDIDLIATPEQYHWDFGDGHTATHDTPGPAYTKGRPMDEYHTHTYQKTGTFDVELTIDYHVRWNAGDGWQDLDNTIASEPDDPHTLQVVEKHNRLNNGR